MTISKQFNRSILLALSILLSAGYVNAAHHESDSNKVSVEKHKAEHSDKVNIKRKVRRGRPMEMQIERLDTNDDGKVDLNEYLTHAESRFNAMDQDGDNAVTKQEAKEHHKQMRRKHHEKMQKKHEEKARKHQEKLADPE